MNSYILNTGINSRTSSGKLVCSGVQLPHSYKGCRAVLNYLVTKQEFRYQLTWWKVDLLDDKICFDLC